MTRLKVTSHLPTVWTRKRDGAAFEGSVRIGRSRLRAKLILFHNKSALHLFWRKRLFHSLGRACCGAVNHLRAKVTDFSTDPPREHIGVDARYYCVIGISLPHASVEVVAHEAVHAAYAFQARVRRTPWDQEARQFDEEGIAYPAGEITRLILSKVHDITGKLRL